MAGRVSTLERPRGAGGRARPLLVVVPAVAVLAALAAGCTTSADRSGHGQHERVVIRAEAVHLRTAPARVRVPRVAHATMRTALSVLQDRHLQPLIVRRPSWAPAGTVITLDARAGSSVRPGSVVRLVVARPMPRVPRVVGRTPGRAGAALRLAGFSVRRVGVMGSPVGRVVRQQPRGLERARPGTVVTVWVAHG